MRYVVSKKLKKWIILTAVWIFFLAACHDPASPQQNPASQRDTAITRQLAVTDMFFDSLRLEKFIVDNKVSDQVSAQLRDFYNVRNYQFAWFNRNKFNQQAMSFWSLQSVYIRETGDSSIFNPVLESVSDSIENLGSLTETNKRKAVDFELELTRHFFNYALNAYEGRLDVDPSSLKWFIPRKKTNARQMLDSIIANQGRDIRQFEPVNRQYYLLREQLVRYKMISDSARTAFIIPKKKLVPGDTSELVRTIKNALFISGDLSIPDSSTTFNDSLLAGIKRFQERMGLEPDGIPGPATLKELNVPAKERVEQILINMERMKWIPAEPGADYLLVNIPNFRLIVFEKGRPVFNMKVVVGSTQHHTVIFTDKMKYVVFSPYWNVPPGILKNEVLPGIRKDPSYLARHDMEWYNGNNVRQRPGPSNSLGLVKFLFPNNYNIYLHDTPAKSLFDETSRAFSHGCIRIAEPVKLAEWVLRNDSTWTSERIHEAMWAGRERFVPVKEDITVFITYFTAFVDSNGRLNFRKDVYGHDKAMKEHMFNQ